MKIPAFSEKTWKAIGVGAGLLIVIGAVLFFSDRYGTWSFNRGVSKDKQKIANTVAEISNVKGQINELEKRDAELRGELGRDQEALANAVYGQEDAKREVNAALANYNAALKSNSNVDATAEDINKALEKLNEQ